jgi:hypothetical protein
MQLARILDACQGEEVDNWRVIPGGSFNEPGTNLLAGLFDAGADDRPALTALEHLYRAVYLPDARIGIGWGMQTEYTREWKGQRPDWADGDWRDIEPCLAHVLFNGTMVWRVHYTAINRGAGRDGILPWPTKKLEPGHTPLDSTPGGWDTTRWEVKFARLLSDLQGIDDWDFEEQLRGWGLKILEVPPLELSRPGGPREE